MNFRSGRLLVFVLVWLAGLNGACGVRHLPPPSAPPNVVPDIPGVPKSEPAEGMGRLLIDTESEPAKVARVTESVSPGPNVPALFQMKHAGVGNPGYGQKTELLCITPCAIDLRTGAYTLVFTSTRNPEKTSTADVAVPTGTTVLRHALGTEQPWPIANLLGLLSVSTGFAMTMTGGFALALGLSSEPTVDKDGRVSDQEPFVVAGAVIGSVGLAALVTGIVLMTTNRPEKRPGATTTFRPTTP